MPDRYFVDKPLAAGIAIVAGDEARHLVGVMRAKVGDEVVLFDGCGHEADATIEKTAKERVELRVETVRDVPREFPSQLTLAVALPKGDRQKWLVEKLVELGCDALLPLETDRGVAQPVESAIERLKRGVLEASKQSGRALLMRIEAPASSDTLFSAATVHNQPCFIAHPGGCSLDQAWDHSSGNALFAIGPEGGFSDREVQLAEQAGFQKVSLGPTILRIETAAIAIAALRMLRSS